MNCLDFQRQLNADPHRLGVEAETHAESCPACARRLAKQMRLEAELAQSLLVTPPEGLADRVLLAGKLRQRRQRRPLYALAAGLVLAVGIGLGLPDSHAPWPREDLAGASIAHVLREARIPPGSPLVSQRAVSAQFARVGASLTKGLPAVDAAPCDVPGGDGGHVVLETPHGRVTVLLMPNRRVREAVSKVDQGLVAVVHSARRGCYTLVADNAQALEFARALLQRSLRWT